jgi:hypothetical protein
LGHPHTGPAQLFNTLRRNYLMLGALGAEPRSGL